MMMMTMMMMVMLMMMMGVMMVMEMAMIETNGVDCCGSSHHSQTSPCGLLRNEVQQLHDGVKEMMHDAPCGVSVA